MKHILLVDDLSDALAMMQDAIVTAFGDVTCSRAASVEEALQLIATEKFELALVDLALGDGSGLTVIQALARHQPDCAVVVASIHDGDEHLFDALQAGAQGYLLKDHPTPWLAEQLQGIADGRPPLSPAVARRLLRHFQPPAALQPAVSCDLSERERHVLGLLAQGVRIADIAGALHISRHTVGDHVKNIYRKLNIRSRAEAALQAQKMGLV